MDYIRTYDNYSKIIIIIIIIMQLHCQDLGEQFNNN